ncbi:MAG: SMC-Scp complex subunit ScpB [Bacteroidota bacterium]
MTSSSIEYPVNEQQRLPMDETQQMTAVDRSLKHIVEALIFASSDPISVDSIRDIFQGLGDNGKARRVESVEIVSLVEELNREYEQNGTAYRISKVAGGFQFATLPQYAEWVGQVYEQKARRKLSQAALETLAIIAYKQPVSKPEVEAIRGVDADYVIRTLLERNLITIIGRAATVGRPLLYGTTKEFLKYFGINDLSELPKPREIDEILSELDLDSDPRFRMLQEKLEKVEEQKSPEVTHPLETERASIEVQGQPTGPQRERSAHLVATAVYRDEETAPEKQEQSQQERSQDSTPPDRRASDPDEHPRRAQPDQADTDSSE